MKGPLVSIIIPTKNSQKTIETCLKSCISQSYSDIEIVVVDNSSNDATQKIVKKYTKNFFTKGPERSAQRNFGASKAKGEYLFFIDSDMQLSENVAKECVDVFTKNNKTRIGGIIVPEVSIGKRFWEKVKAFERSFYNERGDFATDAARFFPTKVFKSVGGYDEALTGPEDWDLPERIQKKGYAIARIKEVIYHYENIPSLWNLLQKKYYYALKAPLYLKKQKIGVASPKTLFFLRPVFYKYPKKYIQHPVLSFAMLVMLTSELFAGGIGFMKGKLSLK